jgi:predicted LPLAT superfamily acyltransferase
MSGSDTINALSMYGEKGVTAFGNVPGARDSAASWIDAYGHFWLFGGSGSDYSGNVTGELNDLWRYDPTNNKWTWMSGSNTTKAASLYGAQAMAAASNIPGARDSAVSWLDTSNHLWMFGGSTFSSTTEYDYNDLWRYQP